MFSLVLDRYHVRDLKGSERLKGGITPRVTSLALSVVTQSLPLLRPLGAHGDTTKHGLHNKDEKHRSAKGQSLPSVLPQWTEIQMEYVDKKFEHVELLSQ